MFKTFEMELAGRKLVIETGKMAKQASGAVLVRYGDTVVLVTSTISKEAREGTDFFPPLQWIMKKKCMRWVRCREDSSEEKVVRETLPF